MLITFILYNRYQFEFYWKSNDNEFIEIIIKYNPVDFVLINTDKNNENYVPQTFYSYFNGNPIYYNIMPTLSRYCSIITGSNNAMIDINRYYE